MLSLKDLQLARVYKQLENNASAKIDDSRLLDILATVADPPCRS